MRHTSFLGRLCRHMLAVQLIAVAFSPASSRADLGTENKFRSPATFSSALSEFFREDAAEFSKLRQETIFPGAIEGLERSLGARDVRYLNRIQVGTGMPFVLIDTEGTSLFNRIAREVFRKWQVVIALDPNMRFGALGAYQGINGRDLKGLMITRTLDSPVTLTNMYHEFLHAALTDEEFNGKAHPLSLYFFRNPNLPYDGIQYGQYLSAQELVTFLGQALVHSESTQKYVEVLFDLTKIVEEFKGATPTGRVVKKLHKGMELVGIETALGDFYVPRSELGGSESNEDSARRYVQTKITKVVALSELVRAVYQPLLEDLGRGIVILKPGLTREEEKALLLQVRDSIFAASPELKGLLEEYAAWAETIDGFTPH